VSLISCNPDDPGPPSVLRSDSSLPEEAVFVAEVEGAFREYKINVEREPRLTGDSGHEYRPSLFLPAAHLIVEPIGVEVAWNRASAVYVEFGDLRQANGYRLMAVVDDRQGNPSEEVLRLLNQVGDVGPWSRRTVWLANLRESN
jgi:hypothetical protein